MCTDAICAALTWSELGPSHHPTNNDPMLSNIPFYDLDNGDNADDFVIEPTVTFIADTTPSPTRLSVDPASKYLYALDLHLQDTKSDHMSFYRMSPSFDDQHLLAHMDAGLMASTTNRSDYLWEFQSLDSSDTTLRVVDDTAHHPAGIGFLKVPILDKPGFLLVRMFYTPSLPTTIISPASITSNTGCDRYSSFANLDGWKCCLTLHGCHPNWSITFPLHLCHGLLFTHALQSPSTVPLRPLWNVFVNQTLLVNMIMTFSFSI